MEDVQSGNPSGKTVVLHSWLPWLCIVVASALAHGWCLGSRFYMDDMPQIRDNEVMQSGVFWSTPMLSWTQLFYCIQYKLFGFSAVGFHAVNWLLHTAVACVLFGFARDFLRGRAPEGVALFAALLFATHPLASEIPNYARTQDLAWVTLFSLLGCWCLLRFLRDGAWLKLIFTGLAVLGATLSKGPGLFHALMMTGAVGLAFMTPEHWSVLRRRKAWVAGVLLLGIAALWASHMLLFWWNAMQDWKEPRFIGHAYTLARVFWEFSWRAVVPVSLCSDHHIAETLVPPAAAWWNVPDKIAMLAAAAMLVLTSISLWLAARERTRLFGVCLFLFVATILFRVFYLIPEFMPEYRIYPGMPWFCLGAAIVLAKGWHLLLGRRSPRAMAFLLVAVFCILSARRSFLWHDTGRLMADVLRQYPAQARALWELQDRDIDAGRWQAVINRQNKQWPPIIAEFMKENKRLAPGRELPSGHFSLADTACKGQYAVAVAHVCGPAAGLSTIRNLELFMRQNRWDQMAHQSVFNNSKILVLEQAGFYQAALDLARQADTPNTLPPRDIRRLEKELADHPAGHR